MLTGKLILAIAVVAASVAVQLIAIHRADNWIRANQPEDTDALAGFLLNPFWALSRLRRYRQLRAERGEGSGLALAYWLGLLVMIAAAVFLTPSLDSFR